MILLKLDLAAYGFFTDKLLVFDPQKSFHLIYGLNEAGKTTALQAVRDLLYGIAAQTPYGFLHKYDQLRIGGALQSSKGQSMEFIRVKKRKNPLVDASGNPLDEATLIAMLGAMDASVFDRIFGISHSQLEEGGREITAGKGDLGQAIFSTGLGNINVHRILKELRSDTDQLFKADSRSRIPKINALIQRHHDAIQTISTYSFSHENYRHLREKLKALNLDLANMKKQIAELNMEKNRLERMRRALPNVFKRAQLLGELEQLGELPAVPTDEPDFRSDIEERIKHTERERKSAQDIIDGIAGQLDSLMTDPAILGKAESIKSLVEMSGSSKKELKDIPSRESDLKLALSSAQRIYAELNLPVPFDDVGTLCLTRPERNRLHELGQSCLNLSTEKSAAERGLQAMRLELADLQTRLGEITVPDLKESAEAIFDTISNQEDLENRLREVRLVLQGKEVAAVNKLKSLQLWSGSLEELSGIIVPSDETIAQFERRWSELQLVESRLTIELEEAERALQEVNEKLRQFIVTEDVPSLQDLIEIRDKRDSIWQIIKNVWIEHVAIEELPNHYSTNEELALVHEEKTTQSDWTADRIREKADESARLNQMLSSQVQLSEKIERLEEKRRNQNDRFLALRSEWGECWMGLSADPESPLGMKAWILARGNILDIQHEILVLRSQVAALENNIREDRKVLSNELAQSFGMNLKELENKPVKVLLSILGKVLEQERDLRISHDSLSKQIKDLEGRVRAQNRQLEKTSKGLADRRAEWQEAAKRFNEDLQPSDATGLLDGLSEMFGHIDDADGLRQRIEAMKDDVKKFNEQVHTICNEIAPDLEQLSSFDAVSTLDQRVREAGEAEATSKKLGEQLKKSEHQLKTAKGTIDELQTQLKNLLQKYGLDTVEQLVELHQKCIVAKHITDELKSLESSLVTDSAGEGLERFLVEASALHADEIPTQIKELEKTIDELGEKADDLNQEIGGIAKELKGIDGNARAAEAAEDANAILAEIPNQMDRYIEIAMAEFLLRSEIDRYRKDHQDPILARAGELFASLTCGSFSRLDADMDERNNPVLFGIRSDGSSVTVSGMSDGTVDQLYLAFRLASLEDFLRSHESFPFIVDDILIKFDDLRAEACLRVLADLSQKTQVLFFTHQGRHRELARHALGDIFQEHEL